MAVAPSPSIGSRGIAACGKRVHDQCLSSPNGKKGLTVSYPRRTRIRKPVAYPQMTRRGKACLRVISPMLALRNWKELFAFFVRNQSTSQNLFRFCVTAVVEQVKEGVVSVTDYVVLCQLNTQKGGEITTSRKSVVSHERKQIPKGRDETECPSKGGREPNRKLAVIILVKH